MSESKSFSSHHDPDDETGAFIVDDESNQSPLENHAIDETGSFINPGEFSNSTIGPYKLLQELGEGGMGTVYMAEQEKPVRRRVALKVIKLGMDSRQVVARFEAERQALALMDHTNIARVFDAGTTETGRPYFAMELVKGIPITDYCDRNKLTTRERLRLFIPVCYAIQHAHQKGIIHRDIKPSNVLVTLYDGKPVPKVIDFGIAKAMQQKLTDRTMFTEIGQVVGTLQYMSPEQAEVNALDVDTRSDIYSLGAMLYELLTGSTPITKEQLRSSGRNAIVSLIQDYDPPRPSTRISESHEVLQSISAIRKTEPAKLSKLIKGDLDWIVMKTLEKDRTRRYDSADAFALDIERYLKDEMVLARPPSSAYRMKKFVHRNRGWLSAAAVILFALTSATIVSSWQAIRATRAERNAQSEREKAITAERKAVSAKQEALAAKLSVEEALTAEKKARFAAEKAQQLAERERAKAVMFSGLLEEIVGSSDAEQHGWRVSLAETLDVWAIPTLEKFSGDPEIKAKLLHTLGKLYSSSNPKKGVQLLMQAQQLREKEKGPNAPDTLETAAELAKTYRIAGEAKKSTELFIKTISAMATVFDKTDLLRLKTRRGLADGYLHDGKIAKAIEIYEDVLQKMKQVLPSTHIEVLTTKSNLAFAKMKAGDSDEAITQMKATLEAFQNTLGANHPRTIAAKNLLASIYLEAKLTQKAAILFKEIYEQRLDILGPNHINVLASKINYAGAIRKLGGIKNALAIYEEVLPKFQKYLGKNHPRTLLLRSDIAVAHAFNKDLSKAREELEEVILAMDAALGKGATETLKARRSLVGVLCGLNKYKEALLPQYIILEQYKNKYGNNDSRTLDAQILLDELKEKK